jgi:hypothetical protein
LQNVAKGFESVGAVVHSNLKTFSLPNSNLSAQMQDSLRALATGVASTLGVATMNSTLELIVLEVDNRAAGLRFLLVPPPGCALDPVVELHCRLHPRLLHFYRRKYKQEQSLSIRDRVEGVFKSSNGSGPLDALNKLEASMQKANDLLMSFEDEDEGADTAHPTSQPASDVVLDFNMDVMRMSEKLKRKFKRIAGAGTAASDAPVVLGSSLAVSPPPPPSDSSVTGGGVEGTGGVGTARGAEERAVAASGAANTGGEICGLVAVTFGEGHLGVRLRRSHVAQQHQAAQQGGSTTPRGSAAGAGGGVGSAPSAMCGYHVAIRDFPSAADGTDSPVKRINMRWVMY